MNERSLPFVDIHCHMLPGIDDGSDSWDTTLAMARMASADGFSTVIVTPHQLGNYAENDGEMIRQLTQKAQGFLDKNDVPLTLMPGGDVRIEPEMISLIQSGNVLSLGDQKQYVLLELPHELYFSINPLIDRLKQAGMVGILSHPERNLGIMQQPSIVESLVREGCLMQVTAGSLTGAFGSRSQQLSEQMLSKGLVHFCATDAHGTKSRHPKMSRAFQRIAELTDTETALDLCCRNPSKVATGKPVFLENRPVVKTTSFFGSLFRPRTSGSTIPKNLTRFCSKLQVRAAAINEALEGPVRATCLKTALGLAAMTFALVILQATEVKAVQQTASTATRWPDEQQIGPFKVHANFAIASVPGLSNELTQLQREVSTTFQLAPPREPINLFLFRGKSSYRNYLKHYFPDVPSRKATYVKKRGPGMVFAYIGEDFFVDLRHETTHALLHANLSVVPLWLDEGIAEYFEVASANRATGHPSWGSLKRKALFGRLRSIETLEALTNVAKMGQGDYDEAFSWVHFMLHDNAAHLELNSFLNDISNSNPPGILSRRLHGKIDTLDRKHKDHVSSWTPKKAARSLNSHIR